VIADDHPVFLGGLRTLIQTDPMFEIVAECLDGMSALRALHDLKPDLAILDIAMPGLSGVEVLAALDDRSPTRIIFLTASANDSHIAEAVARGAYGFMLKDAAADTLLECMREVATGNHWFSTELVNPAFTLPVAHPDEGERTSNTLTPREYEIIRLVAEGLSNKEIGSHIGVTEGTVKIHLHNIYQKLDVNNRTALAAWVLSYGNNAKISGPSR
jgi:DNA-binding NarL/FixJ family response regulator